MLDEAGAAPPPSERDLRRMVILYQRQVTRSARQQISLLCSVRTLPLRVDSEREGPDLVPTLAIGSGN